MWKAFWYGFWVIVKAVFSALGIVGACLKGFTQDVKPFFDFL